MRCCLMPKIRGGTHQAGITLRNPASRLAGVTQPRPLLRNRGLFEMGDAIAVPQEAGCIIAVKPGATALNRFVAGSRERANGGHVLQAAGWKPVAIVHVFMHRLQAVPG